jgi:signal transduction histidine kinase
LSQPDSRLSTLYRYDILDTPAEAGFDDVVRLASIVCETPVALVSFVSFDRQWFKARVGFDACETPLNQSVCAHVVAQRELLVIPDLTLDPRTRENALVTGGPNIRFYAGAPLVAPDDEVLGALCVIDDKVRPKGLSDTQAEALAMLARQVMTQMELRRINKSVESDLSAAVGTAELREQFIAVLGHDLRNPLAALDAGTRILLRDAPSDRARRVGMMMQQSVTRMAGLIDNVVDFARGRLGGAFHVTRSPTLLRPILQQVLDELQSAWPDRPIETTFHLDAPVNCDPTRIGQLFSNLLGNALVHGTSDEPIRVWATQTDGGFELVVSNSSEEISPAKLARLFQPYVRGAATLDRQGLGLGLFIASEIAKAHDGTLVAAWRDGRTTFSFSMAGDESR